MNSSSEPAYAASLRSASRSIWRRRICRGEAGTGEPSNQVRSASTSALCGCHGIRRIVLRSGTMAKSPYPRSHEDIAYPSTVFMSTSTASR